MVMLRVCEPLRILLLLAALFYLQISLKPYHRQEGALLVDRGSSPWDEIRYSSQTPEVLQTFVAYYCGMASLQFEFSKIATLRLKLWIIPDIYSFTCLHCLMGVID